MLRHLFIATEQQFLLELPSEYLGHQVEMIAFCLDDPQPAPKHGKTSRLMDFAGILKDSPNFNSDPVQFQRELRDEWR